ncbi:MAG TPA: glucose 1-dehydrogenase [Solirubrobacteraceae bacterium]|jgi:threonine dehydrogenase-like Zn-dependent dehydrogenase
MKAITVRPGEKGSGELSEMPDPPQDDGAVLVEGVAMGVCGTDGEILSGGYGEAPEGEERLILGHESLGRVLEAPGDAPVAPGDLVAGIVRRPDPVPCPCCAAGEWDMCRNGRYTERGIKGRHGYGSERWRVEPEFCVRLEPSLRVCGVLLEPTTILAKAWEHVERIAARACFAGERCLVVGAGPVGLLGALLAVQRGYELHVIDLVEEGPKPELVRRLGGTYHAGASPSDVPTPDVIIEATGAPKVVFDAMRAAGPGGIVCLTGLSPRGRSLIIDAGALNQELVLENAVVFGSVNANRRHYEQAAEALARADRQWLGDMITRRVPLDRWDDALEHRDDDVKVVVELGGEG